MVACDYGEGQGVPALFARLWFGELASLTGDVGAKTILRTHARQVGLLPFPGGAIPGGAIDLDSPDDYARLTSR